MHACQLQKGRNDAQVAQLNVRCPAGNSAQASFHSIAVVLHGCMTPHSLDSSHLVRARLEQSMPL